MKGSSRSILCSNLVLHGVSCVILIMGGAAVNASADHWSSVLGGADCDSQAALVPTDCPPRPTTTCIKTYNGCNQNSGNATKICQTQAGTTACGGKFCKSRSNDTLSDNGADGKKCTPKQI